MYICTLSNFVSCNSKGIVLRFSIFKALALELYYKHTDVSKVKLTLCNPAISRKLVCKISPYLSYANIDLCYTVLTGFPMTIKQVGLEFRNLLSA